MKIYCAQHFLGPFGFFFFEAAELQAGGYKTFREIVQLILQ